VIADALVSRLPKLSPKRRQEAVQEFPFGSPAHRFQQYAVASASPQTRRNW